MSISPSETYAVNFQISEPKYYTIVPNIISDLTYDKLDEKTGEKKPCKLSVYARELYRVLRMTASGDCAKCWKTTETLADECGMSTGSVSNAKEELQQKFHQLDGQPLIEVKEIRSATMKFGTCINKKPKHEITIINVWQWNNGHMSIRKFLKSEARSPHEDAEGARSPHEDAPQGARSPHEINKNNSNNTYLYKEQESVADAPSVDSVSFSKNEDCFSDDQKHCYEWLCQNGCAEKNAYSISKRFSRKDMHNALEYLVIQMKKKSAKGEKIEGDRKWKYFQDILNKRYWEKTCSGTAKH